MAWRLFPVPPSVAVKEPTVRLCITSTGKRLAISSSALALCGLKRGDQVVIEVNEEVAHLCRVRRREDGDPIFGQLAGKEGKSAGDFAAAGRALALAGYGSAQVPARCGEGWVEFDATPMREAGRQGRLAPAPGKPTVSPAVPAPPQVSAPPSTDAKPWRLGVHPRIAVEVVKMLVAKVDPTGIAKSLGVKSADVLGVRSMVGDAKIAALRQRSDEEREEAYAASLARWTDRLAVAEAAS